MIGGDVMAYHASTRNWLFNGGIGLESQADFEICVDFKRLSDFHDWRKHVSNRLTKLATTLADQWIDATWTIWYNDEPNDDGIYESGISGAISRRTYNESQSLQSEVEWFADELGDFCSGDVTLWTAGDVRWL